MKRILPLLPLVAVTSVVMAEEPVIVITPTGIETPLEETAPSTTVITHEDIERNHYLSVEEALRSTPGLTVARSGPLGQQTSIFIRGTNSNHVLVMIDGVKINDTTSPSGAFDFANLTNDAIERIEVVRGPQSTLYGSDAIGGVINIITRKGNGEAGGSIELFGGSSDTFKQGVTLHGGDHKANYLISLSHIKTEGQDISSPELGFTPADNDGYENTTLTARAGFEISPVTKFELSGQFIDSTAEFDTSYADKADIPYTDLKSWFLRAAMENRFFDGNWKSKFSLNRSSSKRKTTDVVDTAWYPDPPNLVTATFDYEGQRSEIEWRNDLYFVNNHVITAGVKWEQEVAKTIYGASTDYEATTNSFYLQDQFSFENGLLGTIGVRRDEHSEFGGKTTWRIAPVYLVPKTNTRIKASVGTGFKTPSLSQLYSDYGNPDLLPETSFGWEIGFDQMLLNDNLTFGATWFNNELENLIDYLWIGPGPFDGSLENVEHAETEGLETFISYQFSNHISTRFDYTWMRTKDENGDPLLRRPEHAADVSVIYAPSEKASVSALVHYIGERSDNHRVFWGTPVELNSYTTLDLNGQYKLNNRATLNASFTNITDTDYQPAHGYQGESRRIYLGINVKL